MRTSSKESTPEGHDLNLPLEGAVELKAPVFALGYAEAGKGTKAEGRRKNIESMPIENPVTRGRTWF